eukprot:TRINITY_DN1797_c0_g1_i1.p2 TRINITY_DN1797_c0_g1~~TRINITY_DN1797_c0_g1_i1.p2  ORF type:complete len:238 (-),score=45.93 TRINITY_DN1797_c0_g1_i1:336-995(-)
MTGMSLCYKCQFVGGRARARGLVVQAATSLPSKFSKVSPVGDRVFVKVDSEEESTPSGILLPTAAQKKQLRGTVEVIGSVKQVSVGDRVMYSKYAGTEISMQDSDFVLLKEADVIGKLGDSESIAKLQPLGSRVLLKAPEVEQSTGGGVILTTEATEKPCLGEVVAVGDGDIDDDGNKQAVNVQPGQMVMYSKYSGAEFEDGDDKYVVLKEAELLASLA